MTGNDAGRADRASDLRRFELCPSNSTRTPCSPTPLAEATRTPRKILAAPLRGCVETLAAVPEFRRFLGSWVGARSRQRATNSTRRAQHYAASRPRSPEFHADEPTDEVDERLSAQAALQFPAAARARGAPSSCAWEGLSTAEAAEVLECSHRVLAVRVHRARRRLRGYIVEAPPDIATSGTAVEGTGKIIIAPHRGPRMRRRPDDREEERTR